MTKNECDRAVAFDGLRTDLQHALERLMSLREGDLGLLEVLRYGDQAILPLRELLFQREPSGVYQPRCRVAEALGRLGALDILIDFLRSPRNDILDPVERAGEEAVANAAVRALHGSQDEQLFPLLLSLAADRQLPAAVEALGRFRLREALPCIVTALEDDLARPAAEAALRAYGAAATAALLLAAERRAPEARAESESSRRRRRSALGLLLELVPCPRWAAERLRDLANDLDPTVAVLACRLQLLSDPANAQRAEAVTRLVALLPTVDWMMRQDIVDCLAANADVAAGIIAAALPSERPPSPTDFSKGADVHRTLLRAQARLQPRSTKPGYEDHACGNAN